MRVSFHSRLARRSCSRRQAGACAQAGVGLIEVLMAVLIVSVAFLGIAALQARSLSTNNSAMVRSMATMASYSILDVMRADLAGAKAGSYNTSQALKADKCPAADDSHAGQQLNQWCRQLADNLGAAATTVGAIKCSSTGDCTITISFDDSRAGLGGKANQTVETRAIL